METSLDRNGDTILVRHGDSHRGTALGGHGDTASVIQPTSNRHRDRHICGDQFVSNHRDKLERSWRESFTQKVYDQTFSKLSSNHHRDRVQTLKHNLLKIAMKTGWHTCESKSALNGQRVFRKLSAMSGEPDTTLNKLTENISTFAQSACIVLRWIPAHTDISENEIADQFAKEGREKEQPHHICLIKKPKL